MPLIRFFTWNKRALKLPGFTVDASPHRSRKFLTTIRDLAPEAIIFDLDKTPSHSRALAILLRSAKSTQNIPLIFAGGEAEKIGRIRRDLPGSVFTSWKNIEKAVKSAIKGGPQPAVENYLRRFYKSSLPKKLGLKDEVSVINPPDHFEELLGDVDGVSLRPAISRNTNLVIWFVRSRLELEDGLDVMAARLPAGRSMWIAYPKRTGRHATDLTQQDLRTAALAIGLVDYKICSIDADWSALKFTWKK